MYCTYTHLKHRPVPTIAMSPEELANHMIRLGSMNDRIDRLFDAYDGAVGERSAELGIMLDQAIEERDRLVVRINAAQEVR